jgi:hypothetical protein
MRIVIIWLLLPALLFGLGVTFAGRYQEPELTGISLVSGTGQSEIHLKMSKVVEPIIEVDRVNQSLRIDFIGLKAGDGLSKKAFSDDYVRLGYVFSYPGKNPIVGLRVFPRKGGLKGDRTNGDMVVVTLAEDSDINTVKLRASETLLNPSDKKFSPVSLSLNDVPTLPVIAELARKAEIELRFTRFIPEKISIELEAVNAMEALHAISRHIGGYMAQDKKFWWFCGAEG